MNQFRTNYSKLEQKAKEIEEKIKQKNMPEETKNLFTLCAYSSLSHATKGDIQTAENLLDNIQNFISTYLK